MKPLVIFDLDGTLLSAGRAGIESFAHAYTVATGRPLELATVRFAAMPEQAILRQLVALAPEQTKVTRECLRRLYVAALSRAFVDSRARALPGAGDVLARLVAAGASIRFATGNSREVAELKLASSGLTGVLAELGVAIDGGFGDSSEHKLEIVKQALPEGCDTTWGPISLVGDSPSDVEAARALGLCAIAVCTGRFSAEELRLAGADAMFDTLDDEEAVTSMLRGVRTYEDGTGTC
ncbi:MAG TPA: HAD hydrolase-like protein [Polyangiaceae bacterium]|nr:HAD hydrolase-like protein [Polyangiaceae bacterium]